MKVKKLLDKLKDILSAERHAQLAKYASLKKVLKARRVEKARLKKERAESQDENERQEIATRLKVISVQRKKGLTVLKELKKEKRG